eukprot:349730-Chlamydomonas_euryale.AAC.2
MHTPGPLKEWMSYETGAPPSAGVNVIVTAPGPGTTKSVARYWSPNACLRARHIGRRSKD